MKPQKLAMHKYAQEASFKYCGVLFTFGRHMTDRERKEDIETSCGCLKGGR
jgi:hypothetical protein